ncbi:hypothetical protein CXB51_030665 [Gossypium anomalum]|uniref:UDP-N-acetylmuramate--L-alanine ligase n=1 Tax=Gossypium anomalum TaxID=47600 RepID=A0A8J5Y7H3_9ROSI|nr:hypothetical protein CXB51_030665 [Gossypium anomalum]
MTLLAIKYTEFKPSGQEGLNEKTCPSLSATFAAKKKKENHCSTQNMSTSPATSVSDSRYFQPNFLEKVKIKVQLTGLRYKNTVLEKCILASKKNRRISLIKTRATKREQHCNIEHLKDRNQQNWVHFVGVGGCGLSALALIAVKQGFEVSGSDIKWSSFMDGLQQAGVRLHIGHSTLNIQSENGSRFPNCIVVSSAISEDNAEVLHAKSIGIPVYKRDYWLAKLTENHKLIAVSGTHGKSTTSALLAYVLKAMGDDLMAVVGAYVPQANISKLQLFPGGNVIWGDGLHFVLEADEYDGCFLGLSPYIAVLTNVEWEHVDFFQDEEAVKTFFRRFLKRIRVGGHLIICGDEYALLNYVREFLWRGTDSVGARSLLDYTSEGSKPEHASGTMSVTSSDVDGYNIITYGISSTNEWHASSICPNSKGGSDYVLNLSWFVLPSKISTSGTKYKTWSFYSAFCSLLLIRIVREYSEYRECHKGQPLANISLQILGAHNVLNSLAVSKKALILNFVSSSDQVIATVIVLLQGRRQVHELINSLKLHLLDFIGLSRRFERIGKIHGCHIYDDYAHHPTEVYFVLQAARQRFPSMRLVVVFQPHTYSRLAALKDDFAVALSHADHVVVTAVYSVREAGPRNVCGKDLATSFISSTSEYIPSLDDVVDKLALEICKDPLREIVILTLGAGDVNTVGPKLLHELQKRLCIA